MSGTLAVCALALGLAGRGRADERQERAFEPRALQLLQQMQAAYGDLPLLDQRTEFTFTQVPFVPGDSPFAAPQRPGEGAPAKNVEDATAKDKPKAPNAPKEEKLARVLLLTYAAPNRFRLEMRETNAQLDGRPTIYQWVSDGKLFYTTLPDRNWFTRERAPGRLRDFARLQRMNSGSLEMQMLMGLNPLADIQAQADSIRYEGAAEVRGVPTEVIAVRMGGRFEEINLRLYLGKDDFLLRRLVSENTPIAGPTEPGKVGDPLDELAEVAQPIQPASEIVVEDEVPLMPAPPASRLPVRTRMTYDNLITPHASLPLEAFRFTIPTNALLYNPPGTPQPRPLKGKALFSSLKKRALEARNRTLTPPR